MQRRRGPRRRGPGREDGKALGAQLWRDGARADGAGTDEAGDADEEADAEELSTKGPSMDSMQASANPVTVNLNID